MKNCLYVLATFLLMVFLVSCAVNSIEKPLNPEQKLALNSSAISEIQKLGADGDWLVVRKTHATDNMIATFRNAPFSHAAVLDLKKQVVVESNSKGVHVSTLSQFVGSSHRLMLIRPKWKTPDNQKIALDKAYSLLGKGYDYWGLLGINVDDKFYCSELAVAIYKPYITKDDSIPKPIAPDQLYIFGKVLYDSGAN